MFCIQCEQTIRTPAGNGCSYAQGMCGKLAATSDLQDLLIYILQGVSVYAVKARELGIVDPEVDTFVPKAFFSTLTNVNFDDERIIAYAQQAVTYRESLKTAYEAACEQSGKAPEQVSPVAQLVLGTSKPEMLAQAPIALLNKDKNDIHEDILGLRLLCLYGLKGAAAYMEHARVLGKTDVDIAADFH
ncbi:MAG: hydroxylamine reductase, partial [Shewanella sp.]